MAKYFSSSKFILSFAFLLLAIHNTAISSSINTATSKDQIPCTMCSSCENPCQPPVVFSPPPSSPPPSEPNCPPPPPPSSPPPSEPNCPPPPLPSPPPSGPECPPPPSDGGIVPTPIPTTTPPPPPAILPYLPPPPPAGGGILPFPSPPNPIVPYFPFYYYSPPPPLSSSNIPSLSSVDNMSYSIRSHPFVSFLIVSLTLLSFLI